MILCHGQKGLALRISQQPPVNPHLLNLMNSGIRTLKWGRLVYSTRSQCLRQDVSRLVFGIVYDVLLELIIPIVSIVVPFFGSTNYICRIL